MNINHTKMTLEINSCKNYEILEVRQGDKGSRIIDFAFTVNGETVNLASTMSAKVNATVDDVIVADSVAAVVDTENNVVTVTLTDTMLALSGICKMDIVLTEDEEIITAETICLRIGKSVINDDSKAFPGASSIVEITKEVENARGGYANLGTRLDKADTTLATKANKSDISQINSRLQSAETTLKNKANTSDIDKLLALKADKATTLDGYNIIDAYTAAEVDNILKSYQKQLIAGANVKIVDDVISVDIGATYHTVTYNITGATISNRPTVVQDNQSFTTTINVNDNFTLKSVKITMGDVDITTTAYNSQSNIITINNVTDNIVITIVAAENVVVDTTPKIAETNKSLDTSGGSGVTSGACYTDFYQIPDGAGDVTLFLANTKDEVSLGSRGKLQWFTDNTFATYNSVASTKNVEKKYPILNNANKFRTTLIIADIDNSYAYDSVTGTVYFAGKNTKYYGKSNINGTDTPTEDVSIADEVDNQIAMMSLSTGQAIDTSAYAGLSADYVDMVKTNYTAMMDECLGDYNKIPLIVHTDQHGRIGATNPIMKLIGDLTNWYEVSKCVNLGDTSSTTFDASTLDNYLKATKSNIPLSKRLEVYGNHDVWDSNADVKYSVDQKRLSPYFKNIYAHRHGNNGYFTVVDDYYNVKYLVINDMEYPAENNSTRRILTAQAKFVVDELSANDGRDIIILSHVPFATDDLTSRDSDFINYSENFLSNVTTQNSLMDMIKARKNKTSGQFVDSEGATHEYDFSNCTSDLLMSLHGHAHFEAYKHFDNSITQFIFDWFDGNTFYFAYVDRKNKKFKCWKNETDVEALEIEI